MATKENCTFYIGLALLVIGIISLLESFSVFKTFQSWWLPIILIIIGILVITTRKGIVGILGGICLVYGALLLLMTLGVFSVAFLWQLHPVSWILFGLILLL
ncbi:MAG: hypothetical protein JSV88_10955 [Candidatus Aminicenantes bacterium]|nr:MAG: hypothetical protein JSV88_10955 [Candidatus Aminicenantes bacterium]